MGTLPPPMRVRSLSALAVVLALATPSAALAQGAGDEQYQDPFGSDNGGDNGAATPTPTPTPTPAASGGSQPASSTQAPAVPSATAAQVPSAPQGQLPYSGAPVEAALFAAAGSLLVAGG